MDLVRPGGAAAAVDGGSDQLHQVNSRPSQAGKTNFASAVPLALLFPPPLV